MPRRNRVDPFGDLHAVSPRGLFTGNRGCLVNDDSELTRHHHGSLWIVCETSFRGWRHPLDAPHRWTPLFFLDDAVALAAGHRPCGFCRPSAYAQYRDAVTRAFPEVWPWTASAMNRQLAAERLRRGRGLERASDRRLWSADLGELPIGAVVLVDGRPHLVLRDSLQPFGFDGWGDQQPRPAIGDVEVVTPPLSIAAFAHGFTPTLHDSAVPPPHRRHPRSQ